MTDEVTPAVDPATETAPEPTKEEKTTEFLQRLKAQCEQTIRDLEPALQQFQKAHALRDEIQGLL